MFDIWVGIAPGDVIPEPPKMSAVNIPEHHPDSRAVFPKVASGIAQGDLGDKRSPTILG